jgi:hypothetical protein
MSKVEPWDLMAHLKSHQHTLAQSFQITLASSILPQCGVPENSPLPRHFTTWEKEFFEIGAVSFKYLVTLFHQGVEGRIDDVVLVEVKSVGAGVYTLHA